MKKEVSYYLEDISRLNEITQSELDAWIAEMPFHQPLQLLAGIKSDMSDPSDPNTSKVHATYFAEDYEVIVKGNGKGKRKAAKDKKSKLPLASVENEAQNVQDIEREIIHEDVNLSLPEVAHSLADDVLEESVADEVLEEIPEIGTAIEVSSSFADEVLEESVASEVLEELTELESTKEVSSSLADEVLEESVTSEVLEELTELESTKEVSSSLADEVLEDGILSEVLEENINATSESNTDIKIEEDLKSSSENIESTDQSIQNEEIIESSEVKQNVTENIEEEAVEIKADDLVDSSTDIIIETSDNIDPEIKDEQSIVEEVDAVEATIDIEDKELNISESESIDQTELKEEIPVIKKKKSKAKDKASNKKSEKKKKKKKVKYIIVDASKSQKFKLKDYEGVSNYTSWLLEQKSINGKSEDKAINAMKDSKKKKKKKKKSKTLKIAVDSIKKQNSIISEPLAEILATQGHKKKARKMFEKLLLVFPEKKEYYQKKITTLTKGKEKS